MTRGFVDRVARHLVHPSFRGMPRDTSETYTPSFQVEEEQNVVRGQTSPREHFDGEEINAGQDRHMRSDQILPICVLATLRCGSHAVTAKDVSYRLIGNNV